MAVCNLNEITVTGADGFTNANGVYTKQSANHYTNTNGVLLAYSEGGSFGPGWYIVSSFPRYFVAQDPADCPSGLTFNGVFSTVGSFTLPGQSLGPVAARNAKYATATESGANRFRRLNSLGYV